MKLAAMVNRAGIMESVYFLPEQAVPLWCSQEARRELHRMMKARGAVCVICNMTARSVELDNGVCRQGYGCSVDSDRMLMNPQSPQEEMTTNNLVAQIWAAFFDKLPRRGEY